MAMLGYSVEQTLLQVLSDHAMSEGITASSGQYLHVTDPAPTFLLILQ